MDQRFVFLGKFNFWRKFMKVLNLTVIGAAVLLSTSAMANVAVDSTKTLFKTATNPAAVSAEIGTLGYGANIGWSLNDRVELQAGWTGGKTNQAIKSDDIAKIVNVAKALNNNTDGAEVDDLNLAVQINASNPYLGVQLRPAANWFTVGTGVIVPNNKIEVEVQPGAGDSGNYHIGGADYSKDAVGTLKGKIQHRNTLAPYLTVGFRPNIGNNWGLFGEVGATYLGKVNVDIENTKDNDVTVTAIDTQKPIKLAELVDQAERDIESKKDLKWLSWFPIVKVGATYRF